MVVRLRAKRRPEPATAAASKASKVIKTMRVLRAIGAGASPGEGTWDGCALTPVGAFAAAFGDKGLSGLLSAGAVKGVCLSLAGGVNAEGDEVIGGCEGWNENGVKGTGVIPNGWEGCSGL